MMNNNKQLVETRFLRNCGYTIDEAKQLMEGFGVTDPLAPEAATSVDPAKDKASVQYNQLLSILTNLFKGKIPPEIATITSELKTYFSGGPISPGGTVPPRRSQIARTPSQGDGQSSF